MLSRQPLTRPPPSDSFDIIQQVEHCFADPLPKGSMSARTRRRTRQTRGKGRRTVVLVLTASLFGTISIISVAMFLSSFVWVSLPDLNEVEASPTAETSKIFDSKGNLMADLHAEEDRILVPLESISPLLLQAVIAIEDERFYEHEGVDGEAVMRAVIRDISSGELDEGGSTITQQLVKNLYLTPEKTLVRKLQEAALAYQLEEVLTKDEILERYLNTVYFGAGAYGAEAAAQEFFGKEAADLDIVESALLAGIIRAPSYYNPFLYPERAKERRDLVLQVMGNNSDVDPIALETSSSRPLALRDRAGDGSSAPYFTEYVKQQLIDEFGVEKVFEGGLRVFTTIDLDMQAGAHRSIAEYLNRSGDPSSSIVAVDPSTGAIRALVGGDDFQDSKFNLAVQGKRQPGSSFKPFVLATALKQGIPLSEQIEPGAITIPLPGDDWRVTNSTRGIGSDPISLWRGTIMSVNGVYARLVMRVSAAATAATARDLGVASSLPEYPSIALGAVEVSPLDMASAFGALANSGVSCAPFAITQITDASGKLLMKNDPDCESAISPEVAYMTTRTLQGVITEGTGRRAAIGRPAAGKTGTTQEYRDAWFVGYTPQLATSVWVGYPEEQKEMRNVHGKRVSGGTFPAQIWSSFMRKAHSKVAVTDFKRPKDIVDMDLCTISHQPATKNCPGVYSSLFALSVVPKESCPLHPDLTLSPNTGKNRSSVTHTVFPEQAAVPLLFGMKVSDATNLLENAGLVPQFTFEYVTDISKAARVIAQDPSGGEIVAGGSTVLVTVGKR